MHIIALIFFLVFGIVDFTYGLVTQDRISILIGALMVAITLYIWWKKSKGMTS